MFSKNKLGAICYYVKDIDKTEAFYRDTLGLAVVRIEDEHGDWLTAKTANDIELLFFQEESRPGNSPIVVFELPDGGIDDVVAALSEQGVTIVTPVSDAPFGWSAEIADPDNHQISMYQSADLPRKFAC